MTYLGENIGKLGFGLMRLPKKGEKTDVEQTSKMVDLFMEAGFTYFGRYTTGAGRKIPQGKLSAGYEKCRVDKL